MAWQEGATPTLRVHPGRFWRFECSRNATAPKDVMGVRDFSSLPTLL